VQGMKLRRIYSLCTGVSLVFLTGVIGLSVRADAPDPSLGKEVFAKRCSGCHATDSDKEGPRLRGVVGRKAGTVAGFPYSDALRASGIVWDDNLLTKWLENPQALVKDNDMEFRVSSADERASVVVYLKSLGK
jgi:cytochrome c